MLWCLNSDSHFAALDLDDFDDDVVSDANFFVGFATQNEHDAHLLCIAVLANSLMIPDHDDGVTGGYPLV